MIYFHLPTNTLTLASTLLVIFLLFLISLFFNPTVFLYNRKKSSIAGLLYCIIALTDFFVCLTVPVLVLYHAITITPGIEGLACNGSNGSVEPQNCYVHPADPISVGLTFVMSVLNSVDFITTGILAIVRGIQIMFPFQQIHKYLLIVSLVALVVSQMTIHGLHIAPLHGKSTFHLSRMMAIDMDPFKFNWKHGTSIQSLLAISLQNAILTLVQVAAIIASLATAIFLFRQRSFRHGSDEAARRRKVLSSAAKVIITNLMSFFLVAILATPLSVYILDDNVEGVTSEVNGWVQFWAIIILPMVSSVWNPAVFLSLTPKSRTILRQLFVGLIAKFRSSSKCATSVRVENERD